MTKTISDLPEQCLIRIFSILPLLDFIFLDQVCSQWRAVVSNLALLKTTVTLLIGSKNEVSTNFELPFSDTLTSDDGQSLLVKKSVSKFTDRLSLKWLDIAIARRLSIKLRSVTSLEVMQTNDPSYDIEPMIHLLSEWRHALVTLKWVCHHRSPGCYYAFPREASIRVFNSLNRLTDLKNLTIDLECCFNRGSNEEPLEVELSILEYLETLYYYSYDREDLLRYSFRQYGVKNSGLKEIGFGNSQLFDTDMFKYYAQRFGREFCGKFTHLIYPDRGQELESLVGSSLAHFTKLRTLSLALEKVLSIEKVFQNLTALTELIYLELSVTSSALLHLKSKLPALASIKALYLELEDAHIGLPALKIEETFPNLQVLVLPPSRPLGRRRERRHEKGNDSRREFHNVVQSSTGKCLKLKEIYSSGEFGKILGANLDNMCRCCQPRPGYLDTVNRTRMYQY